MVPIEDYLEIMPQNKAKLKKLTEEGKLILGPSYVLPDEYLVSAESLVRNLLIGISEAKKFGNPMLIGYYPDPFGHVSQMPQILNGFEIDNFFFMRGMGDEVDTVGVEFKWHGSDDESEVLAFQSHYGSLRALGYPYKVQHLYKAQKELALKEAKQLAEERIKLQKTRQLLFFNGIDHYHADEDLPEMIEYVNKNADNFKLVHSNFDNFLKAFKKEKPALKVFKGELHAGKHDWLLSGVYSSRMYLKQANEKSQTFLERRVEPMATFGSMIDKEYPQEFINYAWKTLLKNHPHDDICGCGVDAIHRDMVNRFDQVEQLCEMLLSKAKEKLLFEINFRKDTSKEYPIAVFNTLGWDRDAAVKTEMIVPEKSVINKKLQIIDSEDNILPAVITIGEKINDPFFYDSPEPLRKVIIEHYAENLPQCGYKTYYLTESKSKTASNNKKIQISKNGMENAFYKLDFNIDGSFNLKCKKTGTIYKNLNYFEDDGDRGDEYDYSQIEGDRPINTKTSKANIKLHRKTPFCITFSVNISFKIPECLKEDRNYRSDKKVIMPIKTFITMWNNIPRIDIKTEVCNNAKEHRLRAVFPTPIKTDHISVESKFDVIDRPISYPVIKEWAQPHVQTHHQDHFASLSDRKSGITFFNFGLPEYQTINDKTGITYYQTLFRSISWLSRNDLLTRRDNAGPPIYAPEAAMQGKYTFEYSLMTHSSDWEKSKANIEAYSFNTPAESVCFNHKFHNLKGKKSLPENFSFVRINEPGIMLSALKIAENSEDTIIRVFNPFSIEKTASIEFSYPVKEAFLVNLNEDNPKKIKLENEKTLKICLKRKKFQTIKIIFKTKLS